MAVVGTQIGRYRLVEQLGSGGMSVVYRGVDTVLEREVAIKVLHPHLAQKEESRRRLAREARAVAKLHHRNILEVFDFADGESSDAYIVTELIRGQTLRDFCAREPLQPPELAAMVVHQLSSALAHAHAQGIIHRDLKPENVMVRQDGVLKLMDFGIAKIIDRDDRMTMTGALVGSPAHMAPEIIEGEESTAESDVFSLGTILYLLSTGRLPFQAANTTATLRKILEGVYDDPRQLEPALSDELAEIIATCLARQRSDRYGDASALDEALGRYLEDLGLSRVEEELTGFFLDPSAYRPALKGRLSTRLCERAEALVSEGRAPRALACLNQALALDPSDARATALLQRLNVARRRRKTLTRTALAAAAIIGLGAAGVAAYAVHQAVTRPADFLPLATHLTELWLPSTHFPAAPAPTAPAPQPTVVATAPVPVPTPVATAEDPVPTVRAPPRLPATVVIRPFGFIRVDRGPQSHQEDQRHQLQLQPGRHQVTVGCSFCEETTETIEVSAQGPNTFHLGALPKPSRVGFRVTPPEATVTLAGETRTARESLTRPFVVPFSKGPPSFRGNVEYELAAPGFRTMRGVVEILPGRPIEVTQELAPE